jgi:hypothetical protein
MTFFFWAGKVRKLEKIEKKEENMQIVSVPPCLLMVSQKQ